MNQNTPQQIRTPRKPNILKKMDLNELCRICRVEQGVFFIFDTYNGPSISAKIMHCCSKVTITEGDGLPAHICENCEAELTAAYNFALKCEAADNFLRSQTVSSKNRVDIRAFKREDLKPKLVVKLEMVSDHDYLCDDFTVSGYPENDGAEDTNYKSSFRKTKYRNVSSITNMCKVCDHKSTSVSALKVHMRSHTGEKPYSCNRCEKKYKDNRSLKRHTERKHNKDNRDRNFICENCGKGFYSKTDVKIHLRTHTGETPYKCTECPLSFTQGGALLRHMRRHTGEKSHSCPTCSKGFCTKEEMKLHFEGVHSDEKNYSCTICNTHFKYKNSLTKHLRLHSQPKSFVCKHCGQAFNQKGNLKGHIDRQHSEKSGYCDVCSKNVSNLEMHTWKHTGQRPLKCELCSSSFFDTKSLARHVNYRHKNMDKYKCTHEGCAAVFPLQSMLDYHIVKMHETQIPFPCDKCSRGFYRKSDLAKHIIGTHRERLVE